MKQSNALTLTLKILTISSFLSLGISWYFSEAIYVTALLFLVPFFFMIRSHSDSCSDNAAYESLVPFGSEISLECLLSTNEKFSPPDVWQSKGQISSIKTFVCGIIESGDKAVRSELPRHRKYKLVYVGPASSQKRYQGKEDSPITDADSAKSSLFHKARPWGCPRHRFGDIFMVQDAATKKYLAVAPLKWHLQFVAGDPGPAGYFQAIPASFDDEGSSTEREAVHGVGARSTGLEIGMAFRLRSVRWSQYEVGVSQSTGSQFKSSIVEQGLVLFEWSSKPNKQGIVKSKSNGSVLLLNMCCVTPNVRSVTLNEADSIVPLSPRKSTSLGTSVEFNVQLLGWTTFLHRMSTQTQLTAIFLCAERLHGEATRQWISFRTFSEIDGIFSSFEGLQLLKTEEKGESHGKCSFEHGPDQILRSFRRKIQEILTISVNSKSTSVRHALREYLVERSFIDCQFLTGNVGIHTYDELVQLSDGLLYSAPVGRVLWDTLLGEEYLLVFKDLLVFHSILDRNAGWKLGLGCVLHVWKAEESPLIFPYAGYFGLLLETCGMIHILVFSKVEDRNAIFDLVHKTVCSQKLGGHVKPETEDVGASAIVPKSVSKSWFSRLTQSIVGSGDATRSEIPYFQKVLGKPEAFVKTINPRWLPETRRVFNVRLTSSQIVPSSRLLFDSNSSGIFDYFCAGNCLGERAVEWSCRLLRDAHMLTRLFSESPAEKVDEKKRLILLTRFLDEICSLKTIDLSLLDKNHPSVLCFLINIYHVMLLHGRMIYGAPGKQDWLAFFTTTCYEIGDDVYSLSEFEQILLRGKLAVFREKQPARQDPPIVQKSDPRFQYSVTCADFYVNFLLTSGSISQSDEIPVLTPKKLPFFSKKACVDALSNVVVVDTKLNCVTLPKICEWYRDDFGADNASILQKMAELLETTENGGNLRRMLKSGSALPAIKYAKFSYESHPYLRISM